MKSWGYGKTGFPLNCLRLSCRKNYGKVHGKGFSRFLYIHRFLYPYKRIYGLIGLSLKVFNLFAIDLSTVFVFAESIIYNVHPRNINIDGTFDVDNSRRIKTFASGCETFACIKVADLFTDTRNNEILILYSPSPDKPEPKSVRLVREITKYKSQITNMGCPSDRFKRPRRGEQNGIFYLAR